MKIAYSVKEAVLSTGRSEKTIRNAIDAGDLPAYRHGRAISILTADLEAWIKSGHLVGSPEDREARGKN